MKKCRFFILILFALFFLNVRCSKVSDEKKLKNFIKNYEKKVIPLYKEMNISYWKAATTGDKKYYNEYEKLQKKYSQIHSNKKDFELLKKLYKNNKIDDRYLKRELSLLYLKYLQNQTEKSLREKIIALSTELEREFSTYRPVVDGITYSQNDVYTVLKESKDTQLREKLWKAQKLVGKSLESRFLNLVKLRNKAAQEAGFKNYYEMMLEVNEINEEWLVSLFNKLERLTSNEFFKAKDKIDTYLAEKFRINKSELMPWHYEDPYFQEGISVFDVDLDSYFRGKNIIEIAKNYYSSIDLDVNDILKKSDLFERPGKNPHAFEISIDKSGDVRILLNIKDNHYWMDTTLHELGHAVYSKYIPNKLPYILREEAHMFITEAVAMFFGRLATNTYWLKDMGLIDESTLLEIKDKVKESLKYQQLIFSRWAQVMQRFERELYYNPDKDLNSLWWELKEKYQGLKRPENWDNPDYLSKIHIVAYPVYYHNYALGELLASQFTYYLINRYYGKNSSVSFYGKKEIGKFFKDKIFSKGATLFWNKLIEDATGSTLEPDFFVKQFME